MENICKVCGNFAHYHRIRIDHHGVAVAESYHVQANKGKWQSCSTVQHLKVIKKRNINKAKIIDYYERFLDHLITDRNKWKAQAETAFNDAIEHAAISVQSLATCEASLDMLKTVARALRKCPGIDCHKYKEEIKEKEKNNDRENSSGNS